MDGLAGDLHSCGADEAAAPVGHAAKMVAANHTKGPGEVAHIAEALAAHGAALKVQRMGVLRVVLCAAAEAVTAVVVQEGPPWEAP